MPTTLEQEVFDLKARQYEDYVLEQYEQSAFSESYIEHKDRLDGIKKLIRGEWDDLYPDGTGMPGQPLIENAAKSSIRDISGLAAETSPIPRFIPEGEAQSDYDKAQIREAISRTLWEVNNGPRIERRLYRDAIVAGYIVVACSKNPSMHSPYASFVRLRPDRCWPQVRNGTLQNLLYIERVKQREVNLLYPGVIEDMAPSDNSECELVDYYDNERVLRAIISLKQGKVDPKNRANSIRIVEEWEHRLGCVPVAFVQLDSDDEAFRGLLDQAGPPLLSRNRIFQYLMDYIYDMVHAPYEEKNIRNWDEPPGPDTVYHHDPTDPNSFIRRVQPAAPAAAVFGIAQYMDNQTSGEVIQPPSRQGDVRQSIASASFVAATQGRLTTVIKDLHGLMSDLRQQMNHILFKIEKVWIDEKKPLYFPVGDRKTYTPSKDIGDWFHCRFIFGVAAGSDRQTADNRLQAHQGARWISKQTVRDQLEYVDDPTTEQRKIDLEDAMDAFKQRLLTDPRMPLASVVGVIQALRQGGTLEEAAESVMPELQQADKAAQMRGNAAGAGQPAAAPEETPGVAGAQPPTTGPMAVEAPTEAQPPEVQLQGNPIVQQFISSQRP